MATFLERADHPIDHISLCILTNCNSIISRFSFEGWIWATIALVPGLCMLFTFRKWCYRCSENKGADQLRALVFAYAKPQVSHGAAETQAKIIIYFHLVSSS